MRAKRGKRKTTLLPESTLRAMEKKTRAQTHWKTIKEKPLLTPSEAIIAYHGKLELRLLQKASGRAMELMKITDAETKQELHQLVMQALQK